jgi:hypothetical protein
MRVSNERTCKLVCAVAHKQGVLAAAEQLGPSSRPLFSGCGKRAVLA